jgi:hypothetical protein
MNDVLAFLSANSGPLTVLFTGIVTLATAVYAALTWALVKETRLMREVQTEPRMEVALKSLDIALHIVRLHIRNIGLGPALNVRFDAKVTEGGRSAEKLLAELTKSNFFSVGLKYLGPGHERVSHYTQMTEDFDGKIASVLSFDISCESASGKKYSETFVVDMSEYKGTYQLGKPHMYAIAQSLEKLQRDIGHIASGFKRIRADVYTSQDREVEDKLRRERMEADRSGSEP